MSTFKMLVNNFTLFQAIAIFFIAGFTSWELRRWSKIKPINGGFVFGFILRSLLMILLFIVAKPWFVLVISFFSIRFIIYLFGGFYAKNNEKPSITRKTIGQRIPVTPFNQSILWFVIDIFAFSWWMILFPTICSLFFKDTIFFSRWF